MFKALRKFLAGIYGVAPSPALTLHVNKTAEPARERVNLMALVNNSAIRIETHNNRKHLVLPSYTLPDEVVMNGLLYTHAEIERSYKGLEGTFAPLGHPTLDGTYIPAELPEAINAHHIGAFNRNVERRGTRIYLEKFVDIEVAKNTEGGRRLFDRVGFDLTTEEMGTPTGNVHTSTGIFLSADLTANGEGYRGTARQMVMNHDAILLDEPGAATPDQGVGLMVNTLHVEDAVSLAANEVLSTLSYGNLQRILSDAANLKWGGQDKWVWVEDFDATTAIVHRDKESSAVNYAIKDGVAVFAESEQPVKQKTEWVPTVNRILQSLGFKLNSGPDTKPTAEGELEMTPEELAAALAANNTKLMESVTAIVAPVATAVTELQANHKVLSDSLTANSRAAEADKRKLVAEKLGQGVADALTGNALDECHAKLVGAAPIVGGFQGNSDAEGFQQTKLPE